MVQPIYWMDIPATNTTAQYPSDGHGGIDTTLAAAFGGGGLGGTGTMFVTGVQAVASAATVNTVTFTGANGKTFTLALAASTTAGNILAAASGADVAGAGLSGATPTTSMGHALAGVEMGRTFTAAQDQAITWAVRVYFTVA